MFFGSSVCLLILYNFQMSTAFNNVSIELEEVQLGCRTERRAYLSVDEYSSDTCARCYHYMPSYAFTTKFQYLGYIGRLRDPTTNLIHNVSLRNVSQDIVDSFSKESFILKWKGCCMAAAECCTKMLQETIITEGIYCPRTWDGWQCWGDTPAGSTVKEVCPPHIYFEGDHPSCPKYAFKECLQNGTWYQNEHHREWTNFNTCGRTADHRHYLYFHITTLSISVASLIPALIIFSVYKQLQVHRISMHKNLFMSLFLNGLTAVLFKSLVMVDELKKTPHYTTIMDRNEAHCQALFILTRYFRSTNYMWMFCEGFYLHKLIAAAFAEQKNLIMFYVIGWVLPMFPVGIYAILRKTTADDKCWAHPVESYEWIMNAPNMASLLVNLFFLGDIIRVLVTKLRATHSNEPSQYRKAVRATLVLVPLFGIHFVLIIYRPPQTTQCAILTAYTYFSQAMDGLQGLLVSLIFCYLNGEVLSLLWRSTHNFQTKRQLATSSRRRSAFLSQTSSKSRRSKPVESRLSPSTQLPALYPKTQSPSSKSIQHDDEAWIHHAGD